MRHLLWLERANTQMNLLSGSKVDGAAGMRLAARIPLCEESAIHAVGAREWQAFSVSKSQQRSTTDLWTFRAATPAEMLWWISILPARDVVATDNSLLVMPDAVMGADAMLATARRALQFKNHRTFSGCSGTLMRYVRGCGLLSHTSMERTTFCSLGCTSEASNSRIL